jgi:hypothetical protein
MLSWQDTIHDNSHPGHAASHSSGRHLIPATSQSHTTPLDSSSLAVCHYKQLVRPYKQHKTPQTQLQYQYACAHQAHLSQRAPLAPHHGTLPPHNHGRPCPHLPTPRTTAHHIAPHRSCTTCCATHRTPQPISHTISHPDMEIPRPASYLRLRLLRATFAASMPRAVVMISVVLTSRALVSMLSSASMRCCATSICSCLSA